MGKRFHLDIFLAVCQHCARAAHDWFAMGDRIRPEWLCPYLRCSLIWSCELGCALESWCVRGGHVPAWARACSQLLQQSWREAERDCAVLVQQCWSSGLSSPCWSSLLLAASWLKLSFTILGPWQKRARMDVTAEFGWEIPH